LSNAFYDGAYKYIGTGYASELYTYEGAFVWRTAPSGTAGNTITFTQAMTLDASGNLLVGTTSALLSAAGRGNVTVNGTSSAVFALGVGGTRYGHFYADTTSAELSAVGGYLYFTAGSAERARITAAGELLVGKTSATSNGGVVQVSNGITFPATQSACSDANTLDDYEEGTWTPVLSGSGTAGTYELESIYANYTKIGRQVTLTCYFNLRAAGITGGGTGYAIITGVPFAKAANSVGYGPVSFSNVDFSANYCNIAWSTAGSTSTMFFQEINDNAGIGDVDISGFLAGDVVAFSMTYFV